MHLPQTRARPTVGVRPFGRARRVAGTLTALLVASAASLSAGASAAAVSAPACLPKSFATTSKLPGVPVDVTPAPGSGTADPATQISFVGLPIGRIRVISVVGSQSGNHSGRLVAYSQGDGASFIPRTGFTPGERVSVRAILGSTGTQKTWSFGVDTPWSTAGVSPFPNPRAPTYDYQTFATLPAVHAPVMTVIAHDRDPAAGEILTSNGPAPGRYGAAIYAPSGRLVWFEQMSGQEVADDLNVQNYEGHHDLTFWQGHVLSLGFGQGEDVVLNSRYQRVATFRGGNGLRPDLHEFQIAPHGVAYVTAYNPIRCDLHAASGPSDGVILDATALAIDLRTGLVRWEWHALDHVDTSESETSPPNVRAWDWFHINSIDPEPGGDIFISARNTWAGYQLAGLSGTIRWRLGGLRSSFKMGPGTRTAWQHDGRVLANGDITFFDDGDPGEPQSRAVTISLDLASHTAKLVSAFTHRNPPLLAASQGNMQTLPDSNTLVGYGGVPEISEFAPDGSLLFDAHLPYGLIFYRAYRQPWSGLPASPPVAFAGLNNVGETIVYMSWNGATGVRSWRVLAGVRANKLAPVVRVADNAFETSTILTLGYRYAAVQALDANGRVLGRSLPVRVLTYKQAFPS